MKIIVCIKQVLDTGAKIEMQGEKVVASGSPFIMNPYDEFALEEAIRIKSVSYTHLTLPTNREV